MKGIDRFLVALILFVIVLIISIVLKEPFIAGAFFIISYIALLLFNRQKETT